MKSFYLENPEQKKHRMALFWFRVRLMRQIIRSHTLRRT